jgi:hypothetical protein
LDRIGVRLLSDSTLGDRLLLVMPLISGHPVAATGSPQAEKVRNGWHEGLLLRCHDRRKEKRP